MCLKTARKSNSANHKKKTKKKKTRNSNGISLNSMWCDVIFIEDPRKSTRFKQWKIEWKESQRGEAKKKLLMQIGLNWIEMKLRLLAKNIGKTHNRYSRDWNIKFYLSAATVADGRTFYISFARKIAGFCCRRDEISSFYCRFLLILAFLSFTIAFFYDTFPLYWWTYLAHVSALSLSLSHGRYKSLLEIVGNQEEGSKRMQCWRGVVKERGHGYLSS